ncbi:MAG TPA: A24 family peptidase [Bacillales bacterium]|nr:A24 family peptidase [Bacillales bacterium]
MAWSLISLLIIIFISDIRYMLIPDRVLMVFAGIFLIERLILAPDAHWWQPFVGAGVGFIVPFLVAVVSRGNMGGGDIKLFAVLGLILGWESVLLAFFFSTFYGAFIGGIGLIIGKIRKSMPVPFGPFIVMGALTAYFYGDALLKWYFHL